MLDSFISQFTKKKIQYKKFRHQYIQITREQEELIKTISEKPYSAGLLLGEDYKGRFLPSSSLMDWVAKNSDKKVFLNKKSEWFFLCGRMVMPDGIIRANAKDGIVLVQNERDENLGFGKIFLENGRMMIRPIYDKGFFLRREKNKR